jgi:hypothetical protein
MRGSWISTPSLTKSSIRTLTLAGDSCVCPISCKLRLHDVLQIHILQISALTALSPSMRSAALFSGSRTRSPFALSSSHYMGQGVKRVGYVGVQVIEYQPHGIKQGSELIAIFERIKKASDNEAGKIFAQEVLTTQAQQTFSNGLLLISGFADSLQYSTNGF